MQKIVLFDMDGTLTPPRGKMGWGMNQKLSELQEKGYKIGIVTGSDFEYLKDQCSIMFDISPVDYSSIQYFPCNGTKHYIVKNGVFVLKENNDMEGQIGAATYKKLITFCLKNQLKFVKDFDIDISGKFIDYRGSTLNWCPIGRTAGSDKRKCFEDFDKQNYWRMSVLKKFKKYLKKENIKEITVKLGGETSFDIFPAGWDKTFCLKNFKDMEVFFVGDRCGENGNDKEIYDMCYPLAWETKSVENTMEIIDNFILSD